MRADHQHELPAHLTVLADSSARVAVSIAAGSAAAPRKSSEGGIGA